MITDNKITEIFCAVDEFYKEFDKQIDKKSLMSSDGKVRRYRKDSLSDSEMMTILIVFQLIQSLTHQHRHSDWEHQNRVQPTRLCVAAETHAQWFWHVEMIDV